jgi:hypothetical protein
MSTLMYIMLVSLLPFPILIILVLAERWMKPNHEQATS